MPKRPCYPLFLLLCVCFAIPATAQQAIKGTVTDEANGAALEGAIVTLRTAANGLLAFTQSDAKGAFILTIAAWPKESFLHISMLGYASSQIPVKEKDNPPFLVALKPAPTQLKEFIVKPPRITQRKDTLSYNVASFSNNQDRTIGDVLKKLPGIEVQSDGTILYNGRAINKFYIEGLDLLQEKYSLAVNNIPSKDISSVQVLENHQPIKALQSTVASGRAALNLKLAPSAKGKWLGTAEAATGGTPLLWKGNALGMRIAPGSQSLHVLKTNNTGQNIRADLESHTLEDLINSQENVVTPNNLVQVTPPVPPIEEERVLFNRSYLASTNNIWQLKNDYQLRANTSFIQERLNNNRQSLTGFYLPSNTPLLVTENIHALTERTRAEGMLNLNKNTGHYYLNNTLTARGSWENTTLDNTGTTPNTQHASTPYHYLENDFNWIQQTGRRTVKLNSFNHYDHLPQQLVVQQKGQSLQPTQTAELSTFFSNSHLSYAVGFHRWNLDLRAGVRLKLQQLHTQALHLPDSLGIADSAANRFQWLLADYYAQPVLSYKQEKFSLSLEMPVHYYHSRIRNQPTGPTSQENLVYLNPTLGLRYQYNAFWTLDLHTGYSTNLNGIDQLNSGYILRNYRYLEKGSNRLSKQQQQNYSLGISYRNPVTAVFANVSAAYSPATLNLLERQNFSGILSIGQVLVQENPKKTWRIAGRFSKGIDAWKATAAIGFTYTSMMGQLVQQNQLLDNTLQNLLVQPSFNLALTSWSSLEYNATFSRNLLRLSGSPLTPALHRMGQQATIGLSLADKLILKLSLDHLYNEVAARKAVSLFFADASLRYPIGKRLELNLDCNNLFNRRTYAYTAFSDASYASTAYVLRPFNFLMGVYWNW